jgi:hypothetical protein
MKKSILSLMCVVLSAGCAVGPVASEVSSEPTNASEGAFSSATAKLYDFEFDGELVTDSAFNPNADIKNQLFYTIGQLNGQKDLRVGGGVGRLDALVLSNVTTAALPNGKTSVKYHAVLPVGWLDLYNTPKAYTFKLPKDASSSGLNRFTQKYSARCVDTFSAHDVSQYNYWYYYRPEARGCVFEPADLMVSSVTVTLSSENTNGKYPEYNRIWADNELNVIVIFGKDKSGSTSASDFGIAQYGLFNAKLRFSAYDARLTRVSCFGRPNNSCDGILEAPGADFPEVTWAGTFPDGRKINVTAMLINAPTNTTTAFDQRYAQLTPKADLIIYNGHAALGDNVKALTRKGTFVAGQYTIVSMMGCDSFAYVDGYMSQQRAKLNADDVKGTKYLDMITNLMPTNPTKLTPASFVMIETLSDIAHPKTYEQILKRYEFDHFPVVTGDEDNEFVPAVK